MLKGIDIANCNEGFSVRRAKPEFVIVKATDGISFIDRVGPGWIKDAQDLDIPFGFYHFARTYDPASEARFFYDQTKQWLGFGIPVVDIELTQITNAWIDQFVATYNDLAGIWPWIYINADFINNRGYGTDLLKAKCPLWLAGYPRDYRSYPNDPTCPYRHGTWNLVAWQFTGMLDLDGMDIDGDFYYGSVETWNAYARTSKIVNNVSSATTLELASDVIRGVYGNGLERRKALGARYPEVQAKVNDLFDKAVKVTKGKYGNGRDRMQALGDEYSIVQFIVNALMKG